MSFPAVHVVCLHVSCVVLQVVSTVLLNVIPEGQQPLNLLSRAKINPQEWGRGKGQGQALQDTFMTESEVCSFCVADVPLVCGVAVVHDSHPVRSCSGRGSCCVECWTSPSSGPPSSALCTAARSCMEGLWPTSYCRPSAASSPRSCSCVASLWVWKTFLLGQRYSY